MHELKIAAKSPGGDHYHIAYLDKEEGVGVITDADGHTHNVMMVAGPDGSPQWQVEPHIDGHSHAIEDYVPKYPKSEQEDAEVIKECVSLFKTAEEIESASIKAARESEEFYQGEQWDPAVKDSLEAQKRACLVINKTQKEVDTLCGHQRQQRTDLRFLPVGDGDQMVADILNVLSKNDLEQCYFEREESKVFFNQAVPGRGLFNLYVSFEKDLRGDPKVESFPWDGCVFGPHEKEDLEDCEYLVKHRMFSMGKIKSIWKKKAEDIEADYKDYCDSSGTHTQYSTEQYLESTNKTPVRIGDVPMVDIARKEMRVMECWRKVYLESAVLYDARTEEQFPLFGWKSKDKKALQSLPGVYVIDKNIAKMRITRICGGTVLSDEFPADLPADDFFVVPVYANKRGNKFWGKVEIAKDPQREINKRTSQMIDIGNRMASYGWFIDDGTFPEGEKENFKRNSGTPGFVQEVNDLSKIPLQVEGVSYPTEIANQLMMNHQMMTELMNISVPPAEGDSPASILQQQRLRLVGNENLFDNLSFAKKKLGRLLVAIYQKYYTPERIFRVLSNANSRQPISLGGQPFEEISRDVILQVLQTADLSKYDVVVSESTWSPSEQLGTQLLLVELLNKGVPVGPQSIVALSQIPQGEKDKILQGIDQQQATQANTESKKYEAEVQKSLIAQGVFPPKVLQEQGIDPRTIYPQVNGAMPPGGQGNGVGPIGL